MSQWEDALDDALTDAALNPFQTNEGEYHTMSDETFDPTEGEDYFDDGDLANPEPLPTGTRYIGVASVDVTQAIIGGYRKVEGKLAEALQKKGDFRTEIPQVTLNLTALGVAGQQKGFPDDKNYLKSGKMDFWVGKPDKGGRNQLARLIRDASGKTEEDIKAMPIRESAKLLDKVYLTFEVTHTEGKNGGVFQNPSKVKPATADEVALVI